MVDALIVVVLEGIMGKVLSIATSKIVLAWGYQEKLTTLCKTLDMIRAKLRDAESQKCNEAVLLWLKELKEVVSKAENVLDEVQYEMLRREVMTRNKMTRKVLSFSSLQKYPFCKCSFRKEIGQKIENVSKKFFEINKQAKNLGLHNEPASLVAKSLHEDTDSFLDEFQIVGRENDELRIIELLTGSREDEKLTIVPLVGMGGIGKTTLAKAVYNSKKIDEYYDNRTWLCVSVMVDVNTLLSKIYESVSKEMCKVRTRENLIIDLRRELGAKRFFLVLDDVWDENQEQWEDFRSCMLKSSPRNGSGILVTSRNLVIGTNDMMKDSYALYGLSDHHCWSIFEERAFVVGRPPMPELVEIGREIVKKCCGLPLVVKVIGGMLRFYDDKEKWLSIKDSKVWDLEGGERVRSTLKLSFDNLPNSIVKQCFAYCSIFKKDTFMEKEQVIQLWMALGFLQPDETRNKEMEDVGNDIFQILISNSLFQDVQMDKFGNIIRCMMHDLVHELSVSLSRHETLCLVDPTSGDVRSPQVKHLTIKQDWNKKKLYNIIPFETMVSKTFKDDMTTPTTLQTLFLNSQVIHPSLPLQKFKCLRILNFDGCGLMKIHNSIGDLLHLRYLDLSNTQINVLPKSIGKLYHLQTLKLRCCLYLNELPEDVRNLISLRHFQFDAKRLSPKVGELKSLQTLSSFVVGQQKGCLVKELGCMKHLRGKLRISNLEEISCREDAAETNLSEKKNLFAISFYWGNNEGANRNDKDVLEGLQPHANVKSLKIRNFSSDSFPRWVSKMAVNIQGKWRSLDKLVTMKLSKCSSCHDLPMLTNLPLLRHLVLEYIDKLTCLSSSLGQGDDVSGPIKPLSPSLRTLRLQHLKSLEKWTNTTTNNLMMLSPVLEELAIIDCPKIIILDEHHQHPLDLLLIRGCQNLESIRSIQGLTSLEHLEIDNCQSLLEIPDLHSQCGSLKYLTIVRCNKLTSLPSGFDRLAFLCYLRLGLFSNELHSFPSLQGIEKSRNHIRTLSLIGWAHWESIPEEVKYLTVLDSLYIDGFGIRELPIWLIEMSSIRNMHFVRCEGLDIETVSKRAPREVHTVFLNSSFVSLKNRDLQL